MSKRRPAPAISRVEQDFLNALERLKANEPSNPQLVRQAKLGRLKINVSTVAQEAQRSRTLIGHDGCKYSMVRAAILSFAVPTVEPRTAEAVIKNLRADNIELRRRIRLRDSENASLILRLREVESAAKREIADVKRRAARNRVEAPDKIAGSSLLRRGKNVVPMKPKSA